MSVFGDDPRVPDWAGLLVLTPLFGAAAGIGIILSLVPLFLLVTWISMPAAHFLMLVSLTGVPTGAMVWYAWDCVMDHDADETAFLYSAALLALASFLFWTDSGRAWLAWLDLTAFELAAAYSGVCISVVSAWVLLLLPHRRRSRRRRSGFKDTVLEQRSDRSGGA